MSATQTIVDSIPWAVLASWAIANAIPYLSALATRAPSWATGAITIVLSVATSLLTELAESGAGSGFDWKLALANILPTWLVARLHLATALKGTTQEAKLYAFPKAKLSNQPPIGSRSAA